MKKQQLATVTILEIAHDLLRPGRPRKRPGKPRPEAITPWDSAVSYRSPNAVRYSLVGAIRAAAFSIRREVPKATLSRARIEAEQLAAGAFQRQHYGVEWVDECMADTREIQRGLKRAVKTAEAR